MRKNLIFRISLSALCLTLLFACKKDIETHPEVKTLEVTALSPVRILLKAEIVHKGNFEVSDHGFIYGASQNLSESYGTKVSLGREVSEGAVSKEVVIVASGYGYNNNLYARAYLTNSNGTVYGETMSVQLPTVSASNISPATGKPGDLITINGQFHSLLKDEVSVMFGSTPATIEEVSSTKIIVKVPSGITTSSYYSNQVSITVKIGEQTVSSGYNTTFTLAPVVTDFSPKTGSLNSTLTITGNYLYTSYSTPTKVYFGTTVVNVYNSNSNSMSVTVPESITTEKVSISVEINGVKTTLPGEFTVTPHTVTSISPTTVLSGGALTISGTGYPSYFSNNNVQITIGTTQATYNTYYNSSQFNITLPNLAPGDYDVSVKYGPHTVTSSQKLRIQALTLSSFSPSSGGIGREVTLQGVFSSNQSYEVYFGSSIAYSYSNTATSMKVAVPFGTPAGDVKIRIKQGTNQTDASTNFTVLAPSITSFTPSSGIAGTLVTITGDGFSPHNFNNVVKFGTIQAPTISSSETSLVVAVPSNLNPGAMKLTVISNGQTVISTGNFTATN